MRVLILVLALTAATVQANASISSTDCSKKGVGTLLDAAKNAATNIHLPSSAPATRLKNQVAKSTK